MQCLLVLSMHRSGSSCTTGCMNICGFSLGNHPTQVKNKFNRKGYFENKSILGFNELVLEDIGGSWDHTEPLTEHQVKKSLGHKDALSRIIEQEFGTDSFFVIKDPRIAILQNLYIDTLTEKKIDIKILRLRRNIAAVCKSLERAQGIGQLQCVQLDSLYQSYIDRMVCHAPCFEMDFASLLDDPVTVVQDICDFVGIEFDKYEEIGDFVERGMASF